MQLKINDTFNKELPADTNQTNSPRQVFEAAFSYATPRQPTAPKLVHASIETAEMIGLTPEDIQSEEFLNIFSGNKILDKTTPYAMCYGGHQFGSWAGQLGDGRAINLAEVVHNGNRYTLQLKGAGATPYSRTADGFAVLRSSIREHLCSEAMYHLGVPTTRSLSLILTGDQVMRDVLYNGNPAYEKGAVVCRVAPNFIRFGNFQIFAARKDTKNLKKLADYTMRHFFPKIEKGTKKGYADFFSEVAQRTLRMVLDWKRVGFVHGVMNTDNMSILGLTIDYGPYGWLEGYDHGWTPNTTDRAEKRYRFGSQIEIAFWNLIQLANALFPLIESPAPLEEALEKFKTDYHVLHLDMMKSKLGLEKNSATDHLLIDHLEKNLHLSETDMTIFFRNLGNFKTDTKIDSNGHFLDVVSDAFYFPKEIKGKILPAWIDWFEKYKDRLSLEDKNNEERKSWMSKINPKYVLRNYMAQLAIDAADKDDYSLIDELYILLKNPYDEQPDQEKWFAKRPEWARDKIGCSMLSCSS
ncbi:MAG TPA: YdiU family protein [Phaeodactylibacter sp.]|nr:YdiU family protein [Phaeodactylibacter sp.]